MPRQWLRLSPLVCSQFVPPETLCAPAKRLVSAVAARRSFPGKECLERLVVHVRVIQGHFVFGLPQAFRQSNHITPAEAKALEVAVGFVMPAPQSRFLLLHEVIDRF